MADTYTNCVICGVRCTHGNLLTNGKVYHESCLIDLRKDIDSIDNTIQNQEKAIASLAEVIKRSNSLMFKLRNVVFGSQVDLQDVRLKFEKLQRSLSHSTKQRSDKLVILERIYDFWLTYPPDWESRARLFRSASRRCDKCGSRWNLHVHHKIPISRGGDHTYGNLYCLCEKCHSKAHGGRQFRYAGEDKPSAFAKRLPLLKQAIRNNEIVRFSYKNKRGRKSVRSIVPEEIEQVGFALCVRGHCYLRDQKRTFAVKRMRGVKKVEVPGSCYYK